MYAPGIYSCRVISQNFGTSKNGNDQFILQVEPQHRADGDQWGAVEPTTRTIWMTITDKTIEFVAEKLKAIGWSGERMADLDPDGGTCTFVGQDITCICKHEPHYKNQGELTERWDLPGKSMEVVNNPAVAKKLDAMFGKILKSQAKPKPTTPKPAAKPAAATA